MRSWYWSVEENKHRADPFNWIIEGKMAVSWWPDGEVFQIYKREGIKVIINCSEFNNRNDIPGNFHYYHINIPDFGLPTKSQILRYIDITDKHGEKGEAMVTHCVAGCGRTGQMIIAWAAKNDQIPKGMDPIKWLRKLRPCSLETKKQEDFARKIYNYYQK